MIGNSIAHYKVTAKLGAGGMGEVYRATDSKLGRDVALKVLPEAFAQDTQRMARFQREAQVLASLNHPNIAAIYGLEDGTGGDAGVTALVMELVEGPTLAERINAQVGGAGASVAGHAGRMPAVPMDEALAIAKQIAEALEYAHERGIVHRDLKPANIKLTADGQVKVLDFGLAKALAEDVAAPDVSASPTLSVAATKAGFILGTAAYMSPEQARGKSVDRRADVWSFGVVLYEILTGARAFAGEDVSVTLANVIKEDPDWKKLPASVPRRVRELLERCLQKDPKQRLQAIGEARIALEQAIAHPEAELAEAAAAAPAVRFFNLRTMLPWIAAALFLGTTIAAWKLNSSKPAEPLVRRFLVTTPAGQSFFGPNPTVSISPDGKRVAYLASRTESAGWQLFIRPLDQLEPEPLGNAAGTGAFFSPDGVWIGFNQDGDLTKAPVSGGAPVKLVKSVPWTGASWGPDGYIYFSPDIAGGLHRVPASGGNPEKVQQPGRPPMVQRWPDVLPSGDAILFSEFSVSSASSERSAICVLSLKDGAVKTLVPSGTHPKYVNSGHIVYAQAGVLYAVPFDAQRLEVTGPAVPVLRGVRVDLFTGGAYFSISRDGDLVYLAGAAVGTDAVEMVWVDRKGVAKPVGAPVRAFHNIRLSPDGQRVAARLGDENVDVVIYDIARGILSRLTFQAEEDEAPVWTPDGRRVVYSASGLGQGTGRPPRNIVWKNADGSGVEELLWSGGTHTHTSSVSADLRWLLFTDYANGSSGDIWVLSLEGERKARPFLQTPFSEFDARFSPDGKWVAYTSDESGKNEVYVQGFPDQRGGKWQISAGGGDSAVWSANGKEIVFRSGDRVFAAPVTLSPMFAPSAPRLLFEGQYAALPRREVDYDMASDGRLLMLKESTKQSASQYYVVLNWAEELKRLAPSGRK